MSEDRRRGLTVEQQYEMYEMVKDNTKITNKLHTILIGNGVKGKLQEFEEKDNQLCDDIKSVTKSVNELEKKFLKTLGPFIAVPGVLATILVIWGIIEKIT